MAAQLEAEADLHVAKVHEGELRALLQVNSPLPYPYTHPTPWPWPFPLTTDPDPQTHPGH